MMTCTLQAKLLSIARLSHAHWHDASCSGVRGDVGFIKDAAHFFEARKAVRIGLYLTPFGCIATYLRQSTYHVCTQGADNCTVPKTFLKATVDQIVDLSLFPSSLRIPVSVLPRTTLT